MGSLGYEWERRAGAGAESCAGARALFVIRCGGRSQRRPQSGAAKGPAPRPAQAHPCRLRQKVLAGCNKGCRRAGSGPLPHPTPGPGSVHAGPDIPKSPPRPAPAVRHDPGISALRNRTVWLFRARAEPGQGRRPCHDVCRPPGGLNASPAR